MIINKAVAPKDVPLTEQSHSEVPPSFDEAIAGPSSSSGSYFPVSNTGYNADIPQSSQQNTPLLLGEPHDAPPGFSTWDAQFSRTSAGDVYSHDPHLNEDGEALFRFILSKLYPPEFRIHCRGSHKEQRVRIQHNTSSHHHHHNHGGSNNNHSGRVHQGNTVLEEVTVTDFDFVLDLSVILRINPNPEIWTLDHTVPGYRGSMYKEVLQTEDPNATKNTNFWKRLGQRIRGENRGQVRLPDSDLEANDTKGDLIKWRAATRKERRRLDNFFRWRSAWGLAPWTPMSAYQEYDTEDVQYPVSAHPSMTVRQWADDYCHSQKIMKEFNFKKTVYGWDFGAVRKSIEDLIRSTNFTGDLDIAFETTAAEVSIRPDTRLSRAISNKWLVALMWLLLIYPFIWLFRRFSKHGGGRWEVCGAAYSLKSPPVMLSDGSQASRGMKEGEWLRQWQNTILNGVRSRAIDSKPLPYRPEASESLPGWNQPRI